MTGIGGRAVIELSSFQAIRISLKEIDMINFRLVYEQIEAAKSNLLAGTILGYRLALILSDNVAELLMYMELERRFAFDDQLIPKWEPYRSEWFKAGRGPKYSLKEKKNAKKYFEDKAKILSSRLNQISEDDKTILTICHKFRNEAFHRGSLRTIILEYISRLLYITVVNLTLKLPIPHILISSLSSEDENFLRHYGIENSYFLVSEEARHHLAERLLDGIEFVAASFFSALSQDIVERIDITNDYLEEMGGTRDPDRIDRNIQYTQFWREIGATLADNGVQEDDLEIKYAEWQAEGRAKYTLSKIKEWRRQGEAISRISSPAKALQMYWSIDHLYRPFEDEILEALIIYEEGLGL